SVPGGGNRNALNLPVEAEGKRNWSHGLCDCLGDMNTCALSRRRLDYLKAHGTPDPQRGNRCSSDGFFAQGFANVTIFEEPRAGGRVGESGRARNGIQVTILRLITVDGLEFV
ncbi:hypothetical protein K443DRAFT_116247, partial [Laccaria amethystina LaAM-08-1]